MSLKQQKNNHRIYKFNIPTYVGILQKACPSCCHVHWRSHCPPIVMAGCWLSYVFRLSLYHSTHSRCPPPAPSSSFDAPNGWLSFCRLLSHLTHFVSAAPSCPLPPSPPLLTPPNAFFAETPTSFREEMMKRVPQTLAALGGEAQLNNLGHQNSALTLATSFEQ